MKFGIIEIIVISIRMMIIWAIKNMTNINIDRECKNIDGFALTPITTCKVRVYSYTF